MTVAERASAGEMEDVTDRRTRRLRSKRAAYGWTCVTLVIAAALQLAVYRRGGHTALGDIPGRYFAWRLRPNALPYIDRPVEYPVGIGFLAYLTALVGRSASSFFAVTALMSVGLALTMTRLLRRCPVRLSRWVIGLPVMLYVFHNWDLYAMVPTVLGIYAFEAGRDRAAGAWLGLGFCTKLFPGLIVIPLVGQRWCAGDRRGALRLAGSAAVVAVVLNAPVAIASWKGWSYPARFQGARHATWGSLLSWVTSPPWGGHPWPADPVSVANIAALATLTSGLALISMSAVRRHLSATAIGAATVCVFMLSNKVYSPNYDLWLVPFFVLVPFARRQWVAFCAADLAVFVVVFGQFHGLVGRPLAGDLVPIFIFIRAVVIVGLIVTALGGWTRPRRAMVNVSVSGRRG